MEGKEQQVESNRKRDSNIFEGEMCAKSVCSETETLADSVCYDLTGKRKTMRLFICHDHGRDTMDIPEGKSVGAIKNVIKERFKIRVDNVQLGDVNFERNTLVLSFAGAELDDGWILSDLGIKPGSTLRAYVKEEIDPVLYLRVGYNNEVIPILDRIKLRNFPVATLRSMASRRTGLPVGIFRLVTEKKVEMFDCHTLDKYDVLPGDYIGVETWDGWNDLLKLSAMGFTSHVLQMLEHKDEILAKFQSKVALYMAAHFGHVELASTLTRQHGVRCDEPVGAHPLRQWCSISKHADLKKCPIHEAVETGQLSVVRTFVHHNVCSIMARDGNGLQPLNIALRQKQKTCASFLLTKQWSRMQYGSSSVPLAIFARMKTWSERAKDKVVILFGNEKSSVKKKMVRENPLVGQGVYVDGFSEAQINSKSRHPPIKENAVINWALENYYKEAYKENPEEHFKSVTKELKLPKQKNKWSRMATNKENEEDGVKLPPLNKERNKMPTGRGMDGKSKGGHSRLEENLSRPSSSKSAYIQTGRTEPAQAQAVPAKPSTEKPTVKKQAMVNVFTKSQGNDASIPLPLHSVEDTPRPFLFVKKGQEHDPRQILNKYYNYRGMGPREYAIQCLSVAQNFKEKPWLYQVRLAMGFTENGVKKMTLKNSHNLLSPNRRDNAVKLVQENLEE